MGGVRNGKSAGTPEPAAARQEALQPGASDVKPAEDAREAVDRHFRSAVRVLREGSAARAFGELARASRTLPMTPRLAAGLVRFSLLAGTEAAAITLLDGVPGSVAPDVRRAVRRQLARVLRRVDQLPRAIAALEALLAESPGDRRAKRALQTLRARTGDAVSPVLGKLPTRKAGVQAHAVWEDEDSGYRVETVVEGPAGAPAASGAPEGTAVAFPSLSSPQRPPEGTAVAFPSLSSPQPPPERTAVAFPSLSASTSLGALERAASPSLSAPASSPPERAAPPSLSAPAASGAPERTAVAFPSLSAQRAPEVPWSEPGAKSAAQPEPRTKTEIELPALGAVPDAATESRTKTEMELPALPWVSGPETRAKVETGPAVGRESAQEPRKAEAQVAGVRESAQEPHSKVDAGRAGARESAQEPRLNGAAEQRLKTEVELPALGAVRSEPSAKTVVEMPAIGAAPAPQSAALEDPSVPWSAPRPKSSGDTGEITSRALPFPPEPAFPPSPPAPGETREAVSADLTAAPGAAKSARAESPRATELPSQGKAPTSRAEGEGAPEPESVRAPGARAEAGKQDAEELSRSQKLEAQLIARQAWRELAQLYLKRADRARDATVRAEALTRLAEVMENELQDPAGAARMYREIVELTGDRAALREQVRLLTGRGDASLVRRALDEAIERARTARARAGALLTRGERWLHMGEPQKARADFEAAEALSPGMLPVLAGLVRCAGDSERPAATERLRAALAAAPRRAPDRIEGLRVLAQTAEESLGDLRLAQWAWSEVASESPESEQAPAQLVALARRLGDRPALAQLLRAQLVRDSRGPVARQARLELISTLDALGDAEGSLAELRQAVRYEPGHKEAWLLLVDRLIALGNKGEAAWALEHAATAMEDELERERAWERLARYWREVLGNPERAQVFSRRAEGIRQAREEREVPPSPEPPRSTAPRQEPGGPQPALVAPPPALSPAAIEGMADEVTSNTDPSAAPPVVGAPAAGAAWARDGVADGAAPGSAAAVSPKGKKPAPAEDAAASRAERSAPPSARAARPAQPPRLERVSTPPPDKVAAPNERAPGADRGAVATELAPAVPKGDKSAAAAERAPAVSKSDRAAAAAERASAVPKSDKGAAATERAPAVSNADKGIAPTERAPAVSKADKGIAPTERAPAVSKADKSASPPSSEPVASRAPAAATERAPAVLKADKAAAPPSNSPAAERAKADKSTALPSSEPVASRASAAERSKSDKSASPPPSEPAASRAPAAERGKADKPASPPSGEPVASRAPAAERGKADKSAASPSSEPVAPRAPAAERGKADKSAASPTSEPAASRSPAGTERGKADKSTASPSSEPASSRAPAAPSRAAPPVSEAEPAARPRAARARDAEAEPPRAVDLMSGEAMDLGEAPVADTRVISWEAPPGRMDPVRRVVRSRQDGPAPAAPAAPAPAQGRTFIAKPPAPEVRESPARPGATETREAPVVDPHPDTEPDAFRHIRERPLDAKPYRQLAEFFDSRGDPARATLMREIADALEGREPAAPRAQRPPLSSEERAGLRHPVLRTPPGELLACTGLALCRLFPAQGRAASTLEPLRASSGPGAPAVLDALHTVARLLDVNLPELVLAEDDGPPFTAVHAGNPRVLVGRLAVRQAPSPAELRFHAGRALLSLSPDLLALRTLKGGQLLRALALLSTVLKDPRANTSDARVVRESLSPRALERAVSLLEAGTRDFNASALVDAARDSANRAGLVACGAVGPALAALRARRASDSELVELLRFAASERYLALRAPR